MSVCCLIANGTSGNLIKLIGKNNSHRKSSKAFMCCRGDVSV